MTVPQPSFSYHELESNRAHIRTNMPKRLRLSEILLFAMQLIQKHGGEMRSSEVKLEVRQNFRLTDYELESVGKDGAERWYNSFSFHSVSAVKAGFLLKANGIWYITAEGEEALKLSLKDFDEALHRGYVDWKMQSEGVCSSNDETEADVVLESTVDFEDAQSQALEGIREYMAKLNAYEFQDLVAALLRGMGYYTPFVAPKGKDDGIDIIAYRDPLGVNLPRLKVQVKHSQSPIAADVVRQLKGILHEGEIGVVATSGSFTKDAQREARTYSKAMTLIDFERFIELWTMHYAALNDEDKKRLPIAPIYFLKTTVN